MKINGELITAKYFAYDGCHKIYILEDEGDIDQAKEYNYKIYNIDIIEDCYANSCPLRFIQNWKLNKNIVPQCKDATFEY